MLTTIFVSISATELGRRAGRVQQWILVLAIIFPILGTAVSGAMAFYTRGQNWSEASRALASVAQFHAQMAMNVWKLKCIEKPDDENAKFAQNMFDEWSRRFVDIQTVRPTPTPGASRGSGARAGKGR
jgi:hypothetical protein